MCTVHTEPLLRSFRETWEYFYFPRRSNETVHRLGKVRFFLGGGGLGPQRGGSSVKVSTKRGGPYLM